jgi:Ca2+-binding EF-hand superfamily protein
MEEQISTRTHELVNKLREMQGMEVNDNEAGYKMYVTLKDTFNAFDKDGNAELQYPEYIEAWRFLQQPGTEADIKRAFDAVDVDESGLVEWNEFAFSIMGEKTAKYGVLADMEALAELLEVTCKEYTILRDALSTVREDNASRNMVYSLQVTSKSSKSSWQQSEGEES